MRIADIAGTGVSVRISGQLDKDFTTLLPQAAAGESKRRLSLAAERIVTPGIFAEPIFVTAN